MNKVIISRHWHKPEIQYNVTDEGLTIVVKLDDFILALIKEMGNPVAILTKAQLEAKVKAASIAACEKIKEVTKY
jgi:hypothetical protein